MRRVRGWFAACALLAAACGPEAEAPPTAAVPAPAVVPASAAMPDFPKLGTALPAGHTRFDNDSLAGLFTIMSHELEGGAQRPHLVRYEEPVRVALEGQGAARVTAFLDNYLAMLNHNAGIAIGRTEGPGNLTLRFVDGKRFARAVPGAVCVIAGGDIGWEDFARDPLRASSRAVAALDRIDRMTIFVPDNLRPHQARNCVLEEVPQALGLSNDLYGLGMSSFNDDGAHLWPTKLDYLMLRLLYAPEIQTGLDRAATRARAALVLDRLNPAGRDAPRLPQLRVRGLDEWSLLIGRVFERGASRRDRIADIDRALTLIQAKAPGSPQHCHTLVTAGRVLSRSDPARALVLLDNAQTVCDIAHGPSDVRLARIRLEKACAMLRLGRYAEVAEVAEAVWPVLAAHAQDERLAALYTMQADALAVTAPGSPRAASAAELAAAWSAYAVGPGRRAADCRPKS